jgi:hypothetical protein
VTKEEQKAYDRARYLANREKVIARAAEYRAANREKLKEYFVNLRKENREKFLEKNKQYYQRNKEARNKKSSEYHEKNKNKMAAAQKQYREMNKDKLKEWRALNIEKINAWNAKRRAARIQRTPAWLSDAQLNMIECFYFEAKTLEIKTGIKHHVDHIIPLQGKTVSGLHVPENLRVISAKENQVKSNCYE